MTLNERDYALVLTRFLDENYGGQWESHMCTFDSIIWRDGITSPNQSDFDAALQIKVDEFPTLVSPEASGNQKLLDLGLTQAEATALTGYTPPTE